MTKKNIVGKTKNKKQPKRGILPPPKNAMGYSYPEIKKFLSDKELNDFQEWIVGQTCPMNDKGQLLVYPWDVKRFVELVRNGTPTYFD